MPDGTATGVLRVVIADDHYLVREGTKQLLQLDGDIEVVDCVGDAVELLSSVGRLRPDVVITDIRMPPTHRLEGIEAAHRLRELFPTLGVVVLSNHADQEYALALFGRGTGGLAYLLKERVGDREELLRAIRETAAGRSVIDPVVVEGLVERRARQESSRIALLTDREREVLESMAGGRSNTAIAVSLHLTVSAVEKNINAIFSKLGLSDEPATHRRVAAVLAYLGDRETEA
jgi:DNA-binding NarL/FixJ family response regulator